MEKRTSGGRCADPGPDMLCAHAECRRPRSEHAGPKQLGACPGQSQTGAGSARFSIPIAERHRVP